LKIQGDERGHVVTVCGRCGQRATYGALEDARQLYPQVVAVLADEHRVDVANAKDLEGKGAVTVGCPGCGAPVSASNEPLQRCDHCGATIRVPQRFRSGVVMEPFWLLFDGPSPARSERGEQSRLEKADRAVREERVRQARLDAARGAERTSERLQEITCPLCGDPALNDKGWCTSCGHGKPWHVQNPTQAGLLAGFVSFLIIAALDIFWIQPPFPGIGVAFYLIMGAVGSLFLGIGTLMAIDPSGHTISSTNSSGQTTNSRPATKGDGVFFAIASAPFFFVALFLGPLLGFEEASTDPWTGMPEADPSSQGPATCAEGNVDQCLAQGGQLESSDPAGATEAYRMACELGDATGCFNQGVMAILGDDRDAAEGAWRRACDLGSIMGCANLAGSLVERDPAAAEAPARRACEAGESLGCANLSDVLAARDDLDGAVMFAR
jgi:hypothetical protein